MGMGWWGVRFNWNTLVVSLKDRAGGRVGGGVPQNLSNYLDKGQEDRIGIIFAEIDWENAPGKKIPFIKILEEKKLL